MNNAAFLLVTAHTASHLTGIDWVVIAIYFSILLGVAWWVVRRGKDSAADYFLAGRNKRPFLAGLASFAAIFTLLSYIANPGELIQHGPVLIGMSLVALPINYFLVGWLMIPIIMRLPITSAYELLEARLGRAVRLTGSFTFICVRLVWMALLLFTASVVLINVMGWPHGVFPWIELSIGIVTTLYTFVGGIDAVMVTSVMQFFVLLVGALLTLVSITLRTGGVAGWWPHHWQPYWAPQPFFSLDPHVRVTVVMTLVSSIVFTICVAGSDQVQVQRYLTTRNAATARRSYLLNNIAIGSTTFILGIVGVALLSYYTQNPGAIPPHLSLAKNGDAFFPYYISHNLPPGLAGLVVAGLMGTAFIAVGSAINSIATVISKDFIDTLRSGPQRSEAVKVRTARLLAIGIGAVIVVLSMVVALVPGNLIEVQVKTIHLFICPMFGLFFLAMFVPFATPFGAIAGAVYSLAMAVGVAYWDVLTGEPRLSFQWMTASALVVSLTTGTLFSLLPTRGRSRAALTGYAGLVALPLAGAIVWVCRQ